MKQTIKQIARKYLGRAIVGAGLALGSLGNNAYASLPVYQETRQAVNDLRENEIKAEKEKETANIARYEGLVKQAIESFNKGIKDGYFDVREQKQVFKYLDKAEAISKRDSYVEPNSVAQELYSAILPNIEYKGTKGLVAKLASEDLEVKVEERTVGNVCAPYLLIGIAGIAGICLAGLGVCKLKEKYGRKRKWQTKQDRT